MLSQGHLTPSQLAAVASLLPPGPGEFPSAWIPALCSPSEGVRMLPAPLAPPRAQGMVPSPSLPEKDGRFGTDSVPSLAQVTAGSCSGSALDESAWGRQHCHQGPSMARGHGLLTRGLPGEQGG